MENIQEHLRQLLQTFPTSWMLQIHMCIDAPFEHVKEGAITQVEVVSHEVTLHRPNSLINSIYGLLKCN